MATPATFVVVADRDGFVGAFDDLAAAQAATEKYRSRIPMVFSQYPRAAPGSATVWALPYLHAPAVAYASDCAVAAKKAQDALARLGLVPDDDDLAYWEQAMHCIVPSAQRRFDIVTGGSAEADEFHLDQFLLIIGSAPAPLDGAEEAALDEALAEETALEEAPAEEAALDEAAEAPAEEAAEAPAEEAAEAAAEDALDATYETPTEEAAEADVAEEYIEVPSETPDAPDAPDAPAEDGSEKRGSP